MTGDQPWWRHGAIYQIYIRSFADANGESGAQAGPNAVGLRVSAGNSTIKGFTINRFRPFGTAFSNGAGIELSKVGGNHIEANYIGTNTAGTGGPGNSTGIRVLSPGNVIGGTTPAARNVISGNSGNSNAVGVLLERSSIIRMSSSRARTARSCKATTSAPTRPGTAAVPNQTGVSINAPNITVGGAAAGAGNVISGNGFSGVFVGVWTIDNANTIGTMGTGALIQGNRIGTNAAGASAVPNGAGVNVNVPGVHVGGALAGEGNLISGTPTPACR